MSSGQKQILLIPRRRPQTFEERLLRELHGKDVVVPAVDHHDWNLDPRQEIELLPRRGLRLGRQPAMREDQDSEALLHSSDDRADPRTPAVAIEPQLLSIDVAPRFQIVEGAAEILDVLKGPVLEVP